MRRGTRVGEAYVALSVDGTGVNKDIEKALDDVDYEAVGRRHGQDYRKGLSDGQDQFSKDFDRKLVELGKAIETKGVLSDAVSKDLANAFDRGRLDQLFKYVGHEAGVQFSGEFDDVVRVSVLNALESAMLAAREKGDNFDLSSIIKSAGASGGQGSILLPGSAIDKAIKDVEAKHEGLIKDLQLSEKAYTAYLESEQAQREVDELAHLGRMEAMEKLNGDATTKRIEARAADILAAFATQEAEEAAYTKFLETEEAKRVAQAARDADLRIRQVHYEATQEYKAAQDYANWWEQALTKRERDTELAAKAAERLAAQEAKRLAQDKKNGVNQPGIGNSISGIGATLFGAGIFNALFQGLGGAVNAVEKLTGALKDSGDGGNSAFTKIIHGAAGGAIAVGSLVGVLSVLFTTVSGLGGVITALAATITSGLAGAILVAAGAMGAFAVSAGLMVTAFVSLDTAQKKVLKNDFMPLRNEFKGIGQVLDQSLLPATKQWSANLTTALEGIEPLVRKMGPALAQAGDILTKSFSGKGFQQLNAALTSQLPTITRVFTQALGGFFNGLAATLAVILPAVRQFGFYLNDVAQKFAAWATSATGRNAIVDFSTRALASLKSLANFAGSIGALLATVLFSASGQKAGNNIFDGLSASIDNFRKRIAGGEMDAWFARATNFAHGLGETLSALGGFFHALVNDGSMQIIVGILEALATALQILTPGIKLLADLLAPLVSLFKTFADVLQTFPAPLQAIVGGVGLATVAFLKFGPAIKAAAASMVEFAAVGYAGNAGAGLASMAASLGSVALKAAGVAGVFGGLALATHSGASNLSIIGGAATAAAGAFALMPGPVGVAAAAVTFAGTALFGFQKRASDSAKALAAFNDSLNSAKAGQMALAFQELTIKIGGAQQVLDSWRNGSKATFDQIVQNAAGIKEITDELPQLTQNLIAQANQLGISTHGWSDLTLAQLQGKAALVDYSAALRAAGYDIAVTGGKAIDLRNYLLDIGPSADLSKNEIDNLIGAIDSMSPSAIQRVNAELNQTQYAAYFAAKEIASMLNNGALFSGIANGIANFANSLPHPSPGAIISQIPKIPTPGVGSLAPPPGAYSTKTPTAGTYQNPYGGLAAALQAQGPTVAAQIKNAILSMNKQISQALASISKAGTAGDVATQINTLTSNLATSAAQLVNTAQSALSSAASSLGSASSAKAAAAALAKVRGAQRDLAAAIKAQKAINAEIALLNKQKVTMAWVNTLLKPLANTSGQSPDQILSQYAHILDVLKKYNGTLADYANVRNSIANALKDANTRLTNAIALRDQYAQSVTDAAQSFAGLMTAQAQTINGITQAITATDITTNLQSKLDQIKKFQENLKILLAEGLSNDAYKQIVDAGVEQGGAYAQALVNGGVGAVTQTNSLVSQINTVSAQLGTQASNRLYQAGVDAAQGLVDGLTSMSKQLDTAATALGNAIAAAIKRSLGIHSPSRVMYGLMYDNVGDGAVNGLNDATKNKIGPAADALAARVAVSPEVARYAATKKASGEVSGNGDEHHWHITTPTEDPKAVAQEMINEMTGRLG